MSYVNEDSFISSFPICKIKMPVESRKSWTRLSDWTEKAEKFLS